jgi:predicted amidohydrolase
VSKPVKVAAVQLSSGTNVGANVDAAIALVNEAADLGASYVQLPEYFNYLGPAKSFARFAESIPGPTTDRMAEIAASRAVTLHLGSVLERASGDMSFNTSVVMDSTGAIVATYRKAHLFDVNVPGAVTFRESDAVVAGNDFVIAHLPEFDLGLSICFDVRFPEMYRALGGLGAQVFSIPAAFNASTGAAHWEILVRSRAIENHAFVIAAAQCGRTSDGIATFGHTLIVDPWGVVLGEATSDGSQVVVAELDMDEVVRRRDQINVMKLRRPDLYGTVVPVTGLA